MKNDRVDLESYLFLFLKKKKLYYIWKTITKVLLYSSIVSIVSVIPVLSYLLPWWTCFSILLLPPSFVFIFILLRPVNIIKFCADLDEALFKDQSLVVLHELMLSGDYKNIYYNILKNRVFETVSRIEPKSIYPLPFDKTVIITFTVIIFAVLVSLYFYIDRPLPDYKLAADHLQQAARRLAVREDPEETFSTAIDKMNQLEEKLDEKKESSYEIEKAIEDLTREITEQLLSLRRDTLTSLIEEKTIDSERGDNLNRLLEDKLSIDESREFVIDLLTDDSLSENQRSYIQKSYEEYSSDSDSPDSSELAEDIIDSFAPETGEIAEAAEEAKQSLTEALEKLRSPDGIDMESGDDKSESGLAGQQGAGTGDGHELDQNGNSASASGGSDENISSGGDDFTLSELNGIQASLPEGELIIDSDKGILRLEGDEELRLERIEGVFDSTAFDEGLIRNYEIPVDMRVLVKKYFILIGNMSEED